MQDAREKIYEIIPERDDPEAVKNLLQADYAPEGMMSVNMRHLDEQLGISTTMLHEACVEGRVSTVEMLLAQPGLDVNALDRDDAGCDDAGWTALHYAFMFGKEQILEMLLNDERINIHAKGVGPDATFAWEQSFAPSDACVELLKTHQMTKFNASMTKRALMQLHNGSLPEDAVVSHLAPFFLPQISKPDVEEESEWENDLESEGGTDLESESGTEVGSDDEDAEVELDAESEWEDDLESEGGTDLESEAGTEVGSDEEEAEEEIAQ